MAYLVTNPRSNGALNHLIAKSIGVDIRTQAGRDAVAAFKKTEEYRKGGYISAADLKKARGEKKKKTAASKKYTAEHGKSKAAEFIGSVKGKKKPGRKTAPAASEQVTESIFKVVKGRIYMAGRKGALKKADAVALGFKGNRGRPGRRARMGMMAHANGVVTDVVSFAKHELTLTTVGSAAVAGVAHYYVAPMVAEQVARLPYVGEFASENLAYSITGLAAGGLMFAAGVLMNKPMLGALAGGTAFTLGVGLDTVGAMTRREGGYGDLAVTRANPYGDLAVTRANPYGDLAITSLPEYEGQRGYAGLGMVPAPDYGFSEYADAELADAAYAPDDFAQEEGEALVAGPRAVASRFPVTRSSGLRRKSGPYSRHAGQAMHRWAWLVKLVGGEKARAIAALPPQERIRVIRALKQQALATANRALSAANDYSAVGSDGAMGAHGSEGAYGATVSLGAGF
jgi:hypothetical protein